MIQLIYVITLFVSLAFVGCYVVEPEIHFPPEALHLPSGSLPGPDENSIAWRVNENGRVIGWTQLNNRPLYRIYHNPSHGFAVNADHSQFVLLRPKNAHSVWPMAINNKGRIAGALMWSDNVREMPGIIHPLHLEKAIPCWAFVANDDGSGLRLLKKGGKEATLATHINEAGVIGGGYVDSMSAFPVQRACVWMSDTSDLKALHPKEGLRSEVVGINERWIVVQVLMETHTHIRINQIGGDSSRTILQMSGVEIITVRDLSDNDLLAGSKVDPLLGEIGFIYNLKTDSLQWIKDSINKGSWTYLEFRPYAVNSSGTIAGIVSRLKTNKRHGIPQIRAAIFDADLLFLRDISPPNSGVYAEANDINTMGTVVGYAGFSNGRSAVENRAFIVQLEQVP